MLMRKGEDLTKRYRDNRYAIYVPSLQSGYAQYATRQNKDVRGGDLPKSFRVRDLDFLDPKSQLWSCAYTLYSSGQFDKAQLRNADMIRDRKRGQSIVIGDSGGFQLGTGVIKNRDEQRELNRLATNPAKLVAQWRDVGFRRRTLRWLEMYTDYAMTLDMVLWGSREANEDSKSVLRNLSVDQLIDLSVDNLKYFSDNRGQVSGGGTKFLSVLQDIGNGTGDRWYQAIKDFEFEGWAYGGSTKLLHNLLRWCHRLMREKKLDKAEWFHLLQNSPPVFSVVYTAIQQALSKTLGHEITISYDSSSPHQGSGQQRAMYKMPTFTNDLRTWTMSSERIEQNVLLAHGEVIKPLPSDSPLSAFFTLNDLNFHKELYRDHRVDQFAEHLMTNHNIYVFHKAALDSCDLVLTKPRTTSDQVPPELDDFVAMMDTFFEKDDCEKMLADNATLLATLGRYQQPKDDQSAS
jgi:hypothetical protein